MLQRGKTRKEEIKHVSNRFLPKEGPFGTTLILKHAAWSCWILFVKRTNIHIHKNRRNSKNSFTITKYQIPGSSNLSSTSSLCIYRYAVHMHHHECKSISSSNPGPSANAIALKNCQYNLEFKNICDHTCSIVP